MKNIQKDILRIYRLIGKLNLYVSNCDYDSKRVKEELKNIQELINKLLNLEKAFKKKRHRYVSFFLSEKYTKK